MNEHDPIFVLRGSKPTWRFEWNDHFYEYKGRKHTYKLFFPSGGYYVNIWIGKLVNLSNGKQGWITIEREIGATGIDFNGEGLYRWDK